MSRSQKILFLAVCYGLFVMIVSIVFQTTFTAGFMEFNRLTETIAAFGAGFLMGYVENGLGIGFFNKWINNED